MLGQIQKTLKQLSESQAKSTQATQSMAAMQASHNTPPNPLVTSYHTVSSQIGKLLDKKGALDHMEQRKMQELIQEQTGLYRELDKKMGGTLLGTQEENAPVTKGYLDQWLKKALDDELHGSEKDKTDISSAGSAGRPDSPPATPAKAAVDLQRELQQKRKASADRHKKAKARKEADRKKQHAHQSPTAEAILERPPERRQGGPHDLFNYQAWGGVGDEP